MIKNATKFVREVKQEGRKVTWPTRQETVTTTIVVFIMVALVSMFLLAADWIIAEAIEWILVSGKS